LLPASSSSGGFFFAVTLQSATTVKVHATLEVGGPRWQPLNVTVTRLIGEMPMELSGRRQH
jgi:hypothetical protein